MATLASLWALAKPFAPVVLGYLAGHIANPYVNKVLTFLQGLVSKQ